MTGLNRNFIPLYKMYYKIDISIIMSAMRVVITVTVVLLIENNVIASHNLDTAQDEIEDEESNTRTYDHYGNYLESSNSDQSSEEICIGVDRKGQHYLKMSYTPFENQRSDYRKYDNDMPLRLKPTQDIGNKLSSNVERKINFISNKYIVEPSLIPRDKLNQAISPKKIRKHRPLRKSTPILNIQFGKIPLYITPSSPPQTNQSIMKFENSNYQPVVVDKFKKRKYNVRENESLRSSYKPIEENSTFKNGNHSQLIEYFRGNLTKRNDVLVFQPELEITKQSQTLNSFVVNGYTDNTWDLTYTTDPFVLDSNFSTSQDTTLLESESLEDNYTSLFPINSPHRHSSNWSLLGKQSKKVPKSKSKNELNGFNQADFIDRYLDDSPTDKQTKNYIKDENMEDIFPPTEYFENEENTRKENDKVWEEDTINFKSKIIPSDKVRKNYKLTTHSNNFKNKTNNNKTSNIIVNPRSAMHQSTPFKNYLYSNNIYHFIKKFKNDLPERYISSYGTYLYPQSVQISDHKNDFTRYRKNKRIF